MATASPCHPLPPNGLRRVDSKAEADEVRGETARLRASGELAAMIESMRLYH